MELSELLLLSDAVREHFMDRNQSQACSMRPVRAMIEDHH
jgi:hypothetical protein